MLQCKVLLRLPERPIEAGGLGWGAGGFPVFNLDDPKNHFLLFFIFLFFKPHPRTSVLILQQEEGREQEKH